MSKRITNICKIADVPNNLLLPETISFLEAQADPIYKDQVLSEHMYNLDNLLEEVDEGSVDKPKKHVREELAELLVEMGKRDCAYMRIIY